MVKPSKENVFLHKFLDDVLSVKFYIAVTASVFLCTGKISQDNWMNLMLFIAGFHTANTMTSIFKGVPPIIPRVLPKALPKRGEVDDPDHT